MKLKSKHHVLNLIFYYSMCLLNIFFDQSNYLMSSKNVHAQYLFNIQKQHPVKGAYLCVTSPHYPLSSPHPLSRSFHNRFPAFPIPPNPSPIILQIFTVQSVQRGDPEPNFQFYSKVRVEEVSSAPPSLGGTFLVGDRPNRRVFFLFT